MYLNFLGSELKKFMRDSMMRFMVFYPIFFGIIGRFFLPLVADNVGFELEHYADLILVILTLMTPQVFGAIIGFSVLDDRDDNILVSIKVTPLNIHKFLSFRLVTVFIMSFIACMFVMWFPGIGSLTLINIIAISFLASLGAPATGLAINSFSNNKIEGFAVMKGIGTIILFPVLALFFHDFKELIFGFAPGFWPAKAISSIIRGDDFVYLSYNLYYIIGFIYMLILNFLFYQLSQKKFKV